MVAANAIIEIMQFVYNRMHPPDDPVPKRGANRGEEFMHAFMQVLAQAATQPSADQVAKATDAANKAAEAANKATVATDKLAAATKSLADQVPVLSAGAFATILVAVIAAITVLALLMIYRNVRKASAWSLSDALSEDVPVGPILRNAAGEPLVDKEGNVQYEPVMKASSSRLIALLGAVAIMMLYIGAGLAVLMEFTTNQKIPDDTKEFTTFFLYGMVLFAPYIVNKFSTIFSWLK